MSKKLKKLLFRILISLLIFLVAIILPKEIEEIKIALFFVAYFITGYSVVKKAISNIFRGHLFDENFLMTLATAGAFVTGEYAEGVMVMWLYQVGEWFQTYAVGKSRKSIAQLIDINPEYANIEKNGELIEVSPEEIKIGDIIIVKPGEKVPLDGKIIKGDSTLDTAALTGESLPRKVQEGMEIFSGSINKTGLLKIEVTKPFSESTVTKILELVENASNRKAKTENFISTFAKYYTPIVVFAALCLAFLPPLFIQDAILLEYIYRACSFLVISCPCALVISIPLSFFGGVGGASKLGILIKGSNYIETLAKTKIVVLDKTGTLTKGSFEVTKIQPNNISEEELLEFTALAEAYSEHPIASSIKNAYSKKIETNKVKDVDDISGYGIIANVKDKKVCVGNKKLMEKENVTILEEHIKEIDKSSASTIVYIAIDGIYTGYIIISDEIKVEAYNTVKELKEKASIENIVMLTGDNQKIAEEIAKELKINSFFAELLPGDKVEKVEELLRNKKENTTLAFVGDGINDAPVLTRADVGIAMGALGADAAIEAADVVIMDDDISKISTAIKISKRTLRIVKQNIIFALAVKFIVLILGALGIANMWEAVFADVGVLFIAIINAMRVMNVNMYRKK